MGARCGASAPEAKVRIVLVEPTTRGRKCARVTGRPYLMDGAKLCLASAGTFWQNAVKNIGLHQTL
jgi:hypothetical protein